jgi:hypothetical protein
MSGSTDIKSKHIGVSLMKGFVPLGITRWITMRPEHLASRMDELLDEAEEVEQSHYVLERVSPKDWVDQELFRKWGVSALHVVKLAMGPGSEHHRALAGELEHFTHRLSSFHQCRGILRSAREDFAAGLLVGVRELVAAEVFEDLLGMAEYLLEEGYHLPAGAICGAVLEDSLRKLCRMLDVDWDGDSSIAKLNMALYRAEAYHKAEHGQIEAWGKLRNRIDHGDFRSPKEIEKSDVRRMIEGTRDFIVRNLT